MSQPNIQAKIRSNPRFAELVGKRTRFAIILSLVVLVPYYTFMFFVSTQPTSLVALSLSALCLSRRRSRSRFNMASGITSIYVSAKVVLPQKYIASCVGS